MQRCTSGYAEIQELFARLNYPRSQTGVWPRELKAHRPGAHEITKLLNKRIWDPVLPGPTGHAQNKNIDIHIKRATLKVSPSVVTVEGYSSGYIDLVKKRRRKSLSSGDLINKKSISVRQYAGFILESTNRYSIVLTTMEVLKCSTSGNYDDIQIKVNLPQGRQLAGHLEAYDLYFGIAAIKIKTETRLLAASYAHVNDHISIDPEMSSQHCPKSTRSHLFPGDEVIALGRSVMKPYQIRPAPGLFCVDRCDYDCKELFAASCRLIEHDIGGPLINLHGDVIGICLHAQGPTAFLPINIASLWWEHYKKNGQTHQLCLGMEIANLYAAPLRKLEGIIQKFPHILEGVIVEEVMPGSSAEAAGIKDDDVIIQFCGRKIKGVLELFESMWNKVGESVDLVVIRANEDVPVHLSMVLDEVQSR